MLLVFNGGMQALSSAETNVSPNLTWTEECTSLGEVSFYKTLDPIFVQVYGSWIIHPHL